MIWQEASLADGTEFKITTLIGVYFANSKHIRILDDKHQQRFSVITDVTSADTSVDLEGSFRLELSFAVSGMAVSGLLQARHAYTDKTPAPPLNRSLKPRRFQTSIRTILPRWVRRGRLLVDASFQGKSGRWTKVSNPSVVDRHDAC
jgi:hypothetical protein